MKVIDHDIKCIEIYIVHNKFALSQRVDIFNE